jgi:hypothetical protein
MTDDDAKKLGDLSQELPALDLDPASAQRIAARTRAQVGRGPSKRRFIEPVLVAIFVTAALAWALYKVFEVLGNS